MQTNERKSVSELKKLEYVIINESRQVFLSEKERNSNPFARGAAGTMADFWQSSAMDARGHYE